MLTVYYSNRLEVLSKSLATAIRYGESPVFEAPKILVQSQGMSRWINSQLAAELGVAANIDFPYPASFVWSLYSQLFDLAEENPFNKPLLVWRIVLLLQELQSEPDFAAVQAYLEHDDDGLKLYQLAGVIADIFDQYLMYRPDWLAAWEGRLEDRLAKAINVHLGKNNHSGWQKQLWLKLLENIASGMSRLVTQEGVEPSYSWHRARVNDEFFQAIKKGGFQQSLKAFLPRQLYIFSISALPQVFLHTISALVEYIDVHLFILSPSYEYWGDIKSLKQQAYDKQQMQTGNGLSQAAVGNDLLAAWGKVGREQQELLQTTLSHCEIKEYELYQPWGETGLLQALQNDLLDLRNRYQEQGEGGKTPLGLEQLNLGVHSCHSRMRELEVLHDQLLNLFENQVDLKPKDIVVMVPDIDSYAPYIEAVFGSKSGLQKIPFAIADRNGIQEHALLQAFFQLLNMAASDFTLSEVLALLEYPPVQARFGFQDYAQVKRWLKAANVRFGLNRQQHQQQGIDEETFSWRYGLKRLLLGYVLSPDNTRGLTGVAGLDGIAPVSEVAGIAAQDVGCLAELIEKLERLQGLNTHKTAEQWLMTLEQLLEDFFLSGADDEPLLQLLRASFQALQQACAQSGFEDTISFAVISDYLNNDISVVSQGQHFLSGKVNFCTLMPMRSIPFRIVALLGLNDGAFPRQQERPSFDLFSMDSRLGDRNRREDDRYLFLEAVLSARDFLYLSYTGRSIKDNSVLEPSLLLSELLDYIEASYCLDVSRADAVDTESLRDFICFEHALQAFDSKYFLTEPEAYSQKTFFTYAQQWLPAVQQISHFNSEQTLFFDQPMVHKTAQEQGKSIELPAIALHDLQQFFTHPARYLLTQVLPMALELRDLTLADTEPFQLGGLENYYLIDELLHTDLEGGDLQEKTREFQARGELALSGFASMQNTQLLQEVELMRSACEFDPAETSENIKVDCLIKLADNTSLKLLGLVHHVLPKRLLRWRSSKENPAFLLSCWIEHLALAVMRQGRSTQIVFKGGEVWAFPAVDPDYALLQLQKYISFFQQAHQQALFFAPKSAFAYMQTWHSEKQKGSDAATGQAAALLAARTSYYGIKGKHPEQDIWYSQLFFGQGTDFGQEFASYAELAFDGMLSHAKQQLIAGEGVK